MLIEFPTENKRRAILRSLPIIHNINARIEQYFRRGLELETDGNEQEAQEYYLKVLEIDPEKIGAHINLGTMQYKRGNFEEAIKHYRTAATLRPTNAMAHKNMGIVYESLGLPSKAQQSYQKALMIDPRDNESRYNLAHLAFRQQKYSVAMFHYREHLKVIDPESAMGILVQQQLTTCKERLNANRCLHVVRE